MLSRGVLVNSEDASALMEEQLPQQQVGTSSVQGPAQVQSRGDISVPAGDHPLPKLVSRRYGLLVFYLTARHTSFLKLRGLF